MKIIKLGESRCISKRVAFELQRRVEEYVPCKVQTCEVKLLDIKLQKDSHGFVFQLNYRLSSNRKLKLTLTLILDTYIRRLEHGTELAKFLTAVLMELLYSRYKVRIIKLLTAVFHL